MKYLSRWAEIEYRLAATVFKAIIFSGVRQCGKTTLMQNVMPKDSAFLSMDTETFLKAAEDSPTGLLMRYKEKDCIAIDEVQKASGLFPAIKAFVDARPRKRQILLSGSANYLTLPSVHESMAGRLGQVRLRPLTEGEIQGNPPRFIERLFKNDFNVPLTFEDCNKEVILKKALLGGFPDVLEFNEEQRNFWYDAYAQSSAQKDVIRLLQIRKPEVFQKLLELCASHSVHSVNISDLSSRLEVSRPTLYEYLAALETMYLIERVPLWSEKKDTSSSPKLMFCDSGFMGYLADIGVTSAALSLESKGATDKIGNLIETWVYEQLAPLTDLGREWHLFYYRNKSGKEIDFILENRKKDLIAIEVKGSEGFKSEHLKNLRWFKEQFGKGRHIKTVLLYCGWETLLLSEDECVLPMAYLWL